MKNEDCQMSKSICPALFPFICVHVRLICFCVEVWNSFSPQIRGYVMSLRLQAKTCHSAPVEVDGLTLAAVRRMSLVDIERLPISCGNSRMALAELFTVAGNPADGEIHFTGDLSGVHRIGAGMTEGTIRVEGNVGPHVGSQMSGGRIEVTGDAGDWLGAEMRGGRIHVHGRAGDRVAAAYPGSPRGMTGGELLIDGDVGDDLGTAMRRGLVAVGGAAGDRVGNRLIAGTILIGGRCGRHAGAGMRRGTIGLLGPSPELLPTFVRANRWRPPFMRLLIADLQRAGFPATDEWFDADLIGYHGDMSELGRGEILIRA